jgi:hypothetical protein
MREAVITTQAVSISPDGKSVEFFATLDAGELVSGMFIHIPMNSMLDFTVPIKEVVPLSPPNIHVVLDCDNGENVADLVLAFHFDNETLWVDELGVE